MKKLNGVFDQSFSRALGNSAFNRDFIDAFYQHFISQSEEIAAFFKQTNMSAQRTMLHDSLNLMVDYYRTSTAPIGLKKVAEVHNRSNKNIPPRLYETWLESLLDTVEEFDPEYNAEVERAWRETLKPGIDMMKGAY